MKVGEVYRIFYKDNLGKPKIKSLYFLKKEGLMYFFYNAFNNKFEAYNINLIDRIESRKIHPSKTGTGYDVPPIELGEILKRFDEQ